MLFKRPSNRVPPASIFFMRIASERDDLLAQLEARQDEVLSQLDELEARLDKLLAEFAPPAPAKPHPLADAA